MGLLLAIIVGLAVGAVGGSLLQENFDLLFLDFLMGIAGAIVGDAVFFFAASGSQFLLFSWGGLLAQLVGALIFVLIFNLLHRATPDTWEPDKGDQG